MDPMGMVNCHFLWDFIFQDLLSWRCQTQKSETSKTNSEKPCKKIDAITAPQKI